jgi:hypothetical protein
MAHVARHTIRLTSAACVVSYKSTEIGRGPSQAEALGLAFKYLREHNIEPKGGEISIRHENSIPYLLTNYFI